MGSNNKKDYNVFFHTHTVSGIVISIGLFVIFFCGAIALFMENIDHWETNEKSSDLFTKIDYQQILDSVEAKGYDMHGRDFFINAFHGHVSVFAQPLRDSTLQKSVLRLLSDSVANGPISLEFDAETYAQFTPEDETEEAYLGDFIYGLHYFRQLPVIGIYLSGIVSLFFLFAIITGLIVHWKKIIEFFFTFRLRSSIKNLWADAHTVLGVIGLPFQLMYAITGAVFGLTILVFLPMGAVHYDMNQEAMFKEVYPSPLTKVFETKGYAEKVYDVNQVISSTIEDVPKENLKYLGVTVKTYKDENAHIGLNLRTNLKSGFFNSIDYIVRLADNEVVFEKAADEAPPYSVGVVEFVHKIHFADYGNGLVKWLYFFTALLTCFMIIAGVVLWLRARDNKIYADQKKFNTNVAAIYMGVCLGLYPAIAFLFIMVKALPSDFTVLSWIFLGFWVAFTIYAFVIKDLYKITKNAFYLAGFLGIVVPFFNGLQSGLWFWKSLKEGYTDSFLVDVSWLLFSVITLIVAFKTKNKKVKPISRPQEKEIEKEKKSIPLPNRIKPQLRKEEPILTLRPEQLN
ncbi:MAG: PepSY-associated TM helix domain-containing protein [Bacteroidota bacterium]